MKAGDAQALRAALEAGANPNKVKGNRSLLETALAQFFENKGSVEVVRLLLERGAKVVRTPAPSAPDHALNQAIALNDVELMKLLLARTSPKELNASQGPDQDLVRAQHSWRHFGPTALATAVKMGRAELVSLLRSHGADPALADAFGKTPIDLAQAGRSPSALTALLGSKRKELRM